MKPKSTLRSFLAIAGSSLLTITHASAFEYWFDTNDTVAGFGAVAGTWAAPTLGTSTAGWSTDPSGLTSTIGVDITTTTSDTVNITTTGNITVSGTVDVGTLRLPAGGGNLIGGTINFPAVGTIEGSKANGNIGSAITGAGTSLTIFANNENLTFWTTTTSVNNGAAKTIIQQGLTIGQGRFGVAEEQNLSPLVEFDGGVLRIIAQTVTPANQIKSFGSRTVTYVANKNVDFNVNATNLVFTCNKVLSQGSGNLIKSGNAASYLILDQINTYSGITDMQAGWVSVSASANLGDGSGTNTLTFNGGKLQITGTAFTSFGARPIGYIAAKGVELDIADAANTFTMDKVLDATPNAFTKRGIGTLVLNLDNTLFAAASTLSGGGNVVLDYTTNNDTKLANGAALTLTNSDLTLKNGSHPEIVSATTLNAGHSHIAQDGGSSTINLNVITRAAGGTTSFSVGSIAKTDKTNANGILGGWATLGLNWAKNSTNAGDGPITALVAPGDYTAMPTSSAVNTTANYNLAGDATLSGVLSGQSLRIENTADNQILTMGANTLTLVAVNGGLLYAGGSNNKYTISGTGQIKNSAANSEMIFNTAAGTLNINAPLGIGAGVLTKAGTGTLALNTAVAGGTGGTNVNQGTLLVNTTTTSTGTFTVYNKAKLGGTGTIGGSTVINSGGGLTFDLITATGSHDILDLASGKSVTFPFVGSGGSTSLTITSTGGTPAAGIYTLVTAPGGIIGAVPSTVVLPVGWTANAPYIDGTSLKIQITNVPDTTPPTLTSIADDQSGGPIAVNTLVTYTVTFSEDIDASTVTSADFSNSGSSAITIGTITETSPGVFTVQVTPTTGGTLILQIPTTASLTDVAGNPLDNAPALLDDTTITVNAGDVTPPTLTSIGDNVMGGPVTVGTPVTYTVTFDDDMDDTTVSSADFSNSGTSAITYGAITETSPGVFSVLITPTSAGTLILQIPTTASLTDDAGNLLDNDPALLDDTTITVQTPYQAWAALNGAGANLSDDHDGDGVDNGTEYFIGGPTGNTSGFTALPGVTTGPPLTVTWIKAAGYTGAYNTNFVVETSATLEAPWAPAALGVNPDEVVISGNNVTYTFPAAGTKNFARLKVTGP